MGTCGSDTIKNMGPKFEQLVIIETVKQSIKQSIRERRGQIFNETNRVKIEIYDKIDDEEKDTKSKIDDGVDSVNKKTKGGLDKAAANQRKTAVNIVGATQVYEQFRILLR